METLISKERKENIIRNIKNGSLLFEECDSLVQSDRDIVMEAIKKDGYLLMILSDEFKNDKEIVLECVRLNEYLICFASETLQKQYGNSSKEFIKNMEKELYYADLGMCA